MSVDKYVNFISEQQKTLINIGLAEEAQYTHEIDVHPGGWESTSKEEHEKGADKIVARMKKKGVSC